MEASPLVYKETISELIVHELQIGTIKIFYLCFPPKIAPMYFRVFARPARTEVFLRFEYHIVLEQWI